MATTTLFIKNMVCDRCIMAVRQTLKDNGFTPVEVELGRACVDGNVSPEQRAKLRADLQGIGFELLDDKKLRTIEQIKTAIIQLVHYNDNRSQVNLSTYLQDKLHQDYSSLSKLFSEFAAKTVERYYMEQRIERVKELITYNELSLSQIALKMNYSSVAYLSSQFKSITGMTPTQFKRLQGNTRKSLDKI